MMTSNIQSAAFCRCTAKTKYQNFLLCTHPQKQKNRKYHSKIIIMRIVLEIKDNMFKRKKNHNIQILTKNNSEHNMI